MTLELRETEAGWLLPVKARAGARISQIGGIHDGSLKVSVVEAAGKGKANAAIQSLLASRLMIAQTQIERVRGATSLHKIFRIAGLGKREILERLGLEASGSES